jgi:hypothetical protein
MGAITCRWSTRTLRMVVAGLSTTLVTPSFAAPPPTDGIVAYIDQIVPSGAQLADIAHITRHGKDPDNPVTLYPRDQIAIRKPGAVLTVRMLATNKIDVVTYAVTKDSPYTVPPPDLPGLQVPVAAWFMGVLRGADQAGDASAMAASRAVNKGPCYNETGKTNEPVTFRIPILAASRSVLAAGNRSIFVSWQGGAPPFSVTLSTAETGSILAQTVGVRGTCAAYLPLTDLRPGRYRLTLTDAQNVKEQEDSLFVVAEAPAEPRELRDANLPEEARQIYAATWLAVLDHGTWAFEAQQRVAAMDCRSATVEDWLQQWGSSTPCADAKR